MFVWCDNQDLNPIAGGSKDFYQHMLYVVPVAPVVLLYAGKPFVCCCSCCYRCVMLLLLLLLVPQLPGPVLHLLRGEAAAAVRDLTLAHVPYAQVGGWASGSARFLCVCVCVCVCVSNG